MTKRCDSCGASVDRPQISFQLKIEICADPSPPQFTREDLERDAAAEMRELLEKMKKMDPAEAEDEVYELYVYTLCPRCRNEIHRHLKQIK